MIMKNGVPNHTFTVMVQNRAIQPTPSHGTEAKPSWLRSQLKAEYDGSNIHHQVRVESASGITHGTSRRPRQMRENEADQRLEDDSGNREQAALKDDKLEGVALQQEREVPEADEGSHLLV